MNGDKYKNSIDTKRLMLVSDLIVTFQENFDNSQNVTDYRHTAQRLIFSIDNNDKVVLQSDTGHIIGTLYCYYYQTQLIRDILVLKHQITLVTTLHPCIRNKCIVCVYIDKYKFDRIIDGKEVVPDILQFKCRQCKDNNANFVTHPPDYNNKDALLPFQLRTLLWMQLNETIPVSESNAMEDTHHHLYTDDIQIMYKLHNNLISILQYKFNSRTISLSSSRTLKLIKHYSGKTTLISHFIDASEQLNTTIICHKELTHKLSSFASKTHVSHTVFNTLADLGTIPLFNQCNPIRIFVFIQYKHLQLDKCTVLLNILQQWLASSFVYLVVYDYPHNLHDVQGKFNDTYNLQNETDKLHDTTKLLCNSKSDVAFDLESDVRNITVTQHIIDMNAVETCQYRYQLINNFHNIIDTVPINDFISDCSTNILNDSCPICLTALTTMQSTDSQIPPNNTAHNTTNTSCITTCHHRICHKCCTTLFAEKMHNTINRNKSIKCPICRQPLFTQDITVECFDKQNYIIHSSYYSSRVQKLVDIITSNPTTNYLIITKYPNMSQYIASSLQRLRVDFTMVDSATIDTGYSSAKILVWSMHLSKEVLSHAHKQNRTIILVDGQHNVLNDIQTELLYQYNGLAIPWIHRLSFSKVLSFVASKVCYFKQVLPTQVISLCLNNTFEFKKKLKK